MLAAHPAVAENWVEIAQSQSGNITSIDLDSIKVVDGLVRHWQKTEEYSSSDSKTGEKIVGYVTNCTADMQAPASLHLYENGAAVFNYTLPADKKLEFKASPPGTISAAGVEFICRIHDNGWVPFPQLDSEGAQWVKVATRDGSYFVNTKSIKFVDGSVRYQMKVKLKLGNGHIRFGMASNCADLSSAITESLKFDAADKFEPQNSINVELDSPPLKFRQAESESSDERILKFACDYVQAQARVSSGSRKAR